MALVTYVVEGGIGKQVAFTSLLPKLAEKNGEPVQIHTPYVDVYANNPHVKMAFDMGSIMLDDPRILASDDIVYVEPYKSLFVRGKDHLLKSYCDLLGVEFSTDMTPEVYTDHLADTASKWLSDVGVTGDYIMVQLTGGQSPIGFNPANPYTSSNIARNYPPYFANMLVAMLKEKYPDVAIIDCTLPNEAAYPQAIKCDMPWPVVYELSKGSSGFISIDSCLQHFCAGTGVSGVVVWGNTRWNQFGWSHNQNLSYAMKHANDFTPVDINDPRNIMITPDVLVQFFDEHIMGKPFSVPSVPHND